MPLILMDKLQSRIVVSRLPQGAGIYGLFREYSPSGLLLRGFNTNAPEPLGSCRLSVSHDKISSRGPFPGGS